MELQVTAVQGIRIVRAVMYGKIVVERKGKLASRSQEVHECVAISVPKTGN
jgi:hypothetical protein